MPITFTDPAVASKYDTDQTHDKFHHLPGRKSGNGWKGLLSEVPIEVADRIFQRPMQNLLKLKVSSIAVENKNKKQAAEL